MRCPSRRGASAYHDPAACRGCFLGAYSINRVVQTSNLLRHGLLVCWSARPVLRFLGQAGRAAPASDHTEGWDYLELRAA
jgi:hypothetical protein